MGSFKCGVSAGQAGWAVDAGVAVPGERRPVMDALELRRHYPPGVVFHAPHCVDGGTAVSVPVRAAFDAYPSHQFDLCFRGVIPLSMADSPDALAGLMPYVCVETIDYPPHRYQPADTRDPAQADAIRTLCRVCHGTHEHEP